MFGVGLVSAAAIGAVWWRKRDLEANASVKLDVQAAHDAAVRNEILLIDIRRPDEWALTGIPAPAVAIDMRRPDFAAQLQRLNAEYPDRPVAVICARGVRSRRLAASLMEAGFAGVLDVPEGMLGSGAGPGWMARRLPVRQMTAQEKAEI
ncbi:hypothetical protein SuNHUV7_22630 (plasmid) [Pseudoseohaeicola sp. NH-UV-7]|jgi:rhodanese-related sulfurtransferase|nr:hypothetical protein C1J05_16200 [Sulfitobacter sp. JL08]